MRKIVALLLMASVAVGVSAQTAGTSKPISVNIVKEVIPANINIVNGSMEFMDQSGDRAIDANEACSIRFQVANTGRGEGIGCKAVVKMNGTTAGLTAQSVTIGNIAAGAKQTITIPVSANMKTQDGTVNFTIEVSEAQGFGSDPIELAVATRAFVSPMLKIVDYAVVSATGGSQIQKKMPFSLQLMLQNTQHGKAENVRVELKYPENVYKTDGEDVVTIASLAAGQSQELKYELIVNNNYEGTSVPLEVRLSEKYDKYAENKTIVLPLPQAGAKGDVVVIDGKTVKKDDIAIQTIDRTIKTTSADGINSVKIVNAFSLVGNSSVLSLYKNEFSQFNMPDRDENFPYTLFRVSIQGDKNQVRMAKQHLMLDLGQLFQTEKTVTSYNNMVLFLVPSGARNIYITCGDGCEKQLIYSGRLESNKIYDGLIEVK